MGQKCKRCTGAPKPAGRNLRSAIAAFALILGIVLVIGGVFVYFGSERFQHNSVPDRPAVASVSEAPAAIGKA